MNDDKLNDIVIITYFVSFFSWTTLVYKNFEIDKECLKLQKEIDYLQTETKERSIYLLQYQLILCIIIGVLIRLTHNRSSLVN